MDTCGEKVSTLILAGGFSRRMGRDKAWMELAGVPLVDRIARRVLPLADELIFSTNNPDRFEPFLGRLPIATRLVADQAPGKGPLAGIAAGLQAARNDLVLVLAVDMPFVRVDLLAYMTLLAADYQAVVPMTPVHGSGELAAEPLHACYRRSCLAPITAQLQAGRRRVVSFLTDVRTRWMLPQEIAAFDPEFLSFRNVNTPADWELAMHYISRR